MPLKKKSKSFLIERSLLIALDKNKIEAKNLEVADNSSGGASTLRFLITWQDDYTDGGPPPPGDNIDGTLSLAVTEYKAADNTGTGTFKIESPTAYNLISAISAT